MKANPTLGPFVLIVSPVQPITTGSISLFSLMHALITMRHKCSVHSPFSPTNATKTCVERTCLWQCALKDKFNPGWGLTSVWEHSPYIISHQDKQDTPSDQNSQSSLTALMSPYGENNTFNSPNSLLLLLKLMWKA